MSPGVETTSDYSKVLFGIVHRTGQELSDRGKSRVRWIADRIPGDARSVLDVGSGTGYLSNLLHDRGYGVVGIDLVRASLGRLTGPGVQGDGTRMPFRDRSFDVVLCSEIIEHLSAGERARLTAEIWRVARRYVILTVPYRERLRESLIRCDRCGFVFHSWGHRASFDEARVRNLMPVPPVGWERFTHDESTTPAPILFLRQRVFGTYGWDDPAVCPACGNQEIRPPRRGIPVRVLDRVTRTLGSRRPTGWLLALYPRDGWATESAAGDEWKRAARRPLANGAAIDRTLAPLAIHLEEAVGRVSWRLAGASASLVRAAHEAARRLRGTAWEEADPALTRAFQEQPDADPPGYPSLDPPQAALPPLALALRAGVYAHSGGNSVPLASVLWDRPVPGMESLREQFLFFSLYGVEALLRAHEIEGREEDLDRARSLADAWIRACGASERSTIVWDDHITAVRAITLVRLWERTRRREAPASPFPRRLLATLARHAERLALPEFYRAEHNHGVTQAFALLALGEAMRPHPRAAEWVALARARLERQMAESVSASGTHREHSPFYHFYVLHQFLDAARFARERGTALSRAYEDRLRAMALAGAHMLRPDGGLPALGDSDRNAPVLLDLDDLTIPPLEGEPAFRFARTGGKEGVPPSERAWIDADAGVAFLRSGWGGAEAYGDERHLAVRLGLLPTTHVHRDLLSFEFAAYGEDLLVDSGGPYSYGDPLRADYFLKTRAHNAVEIDGADQSMATARLLRSAAWARGHYLEAEHEAYEGVRHRRAFALLPRGLLLILDRVSCSSERGILLVHHLSPRLAARVEGSSVVTTRDTPGPTARLLAVAPAAAVPELIRGSDRPPQGWVATGDRTREAAPVAIVRIAGAEARFATLIVAEPAGRARGGVTAAVDGDPWEAGGSVEIAEDGWRLTVRIPERDVPVLEESP